MSEVLYTVPSYDPNLFNHLRRLDDSYKELERRNVSRDDLSLVRSLFHHHNVHKTFGVMILHRHFDMTPDEKLVEYGGVATPWQLSGTNEIFGGKVVPRCWAFSEGELYPTEFGFNPSGETTYPEATFQADFVRELHELVCRLELDDVFGLTVLNDGNLLTLRGIERTVGRNQFGRLVVTKAWMIRVFGLHVSVGCVKVASRMLGAYESLEGVSMVNMIAFRYFHGV